MLFCFHSFSCVVFQHKNVDCSLMQVTVSPVRKFMAETCSVRFDFENEEGGRRREMRFGEGRDRREAEGKV